MYVGYVCYLSYFLFMMSLIHIGSLILFPPFAATVISMPLEVTD